MSETTISAIEDIHFDISPDRQRIAELEKHNLVLNEELVTVQEEAARERAYDRQRIAELEKHNLALNEEFVAFREEVARERAYDRQRIAKLEEPALGALREETAKNHVDRLYSEMRRHKLQQVKISFAAQILDISVPQIKKVKPYIGNDPRFVIVNDPNHKQRHLIRLVG